MLWDTLRALDGKAAPTRQDEELRVGSKTLSDDKRKANAFMRVYGLRSQLPVCHTNAGLWSVESAVASCRPELASPPSPCREQARASAPPVGNWPDLQRLLRAFAFAAASQRMKTGLHSTHICDLSLF